MKKILAMVLAMMLVLSMSAAFAAETVDTTNWKSVAKTFTIDKTYTITGGTPVPNETLTFSVDADDENNPAESVVTVTDVSVDEEDEKLTVNLPEYTVAGTYHYTITEDAGNTQGVTYSTESIALSVLVEYDYTNKCLTATPGITKAEDSSKNDLFTNEYDMGSLNVAKEVTGNLGDKTKKFDIVVEFTSDKPVLSTITASDGQDITASEWANGKASLTISIAHGESVDFTDIPAGVTYTVTEAEKHTTGALNTSEGYTATYEYSDATAKKIAKSDEDTVKVTNDKSVEIDTGISLDNAPYMILMALVVIAGAALIVKRASANR